MEFFLTRSVGGVPDIKQRNCQFNVPIGQGVATGHLTIPPEHWGRKH